MIDCPKCGHRRQPEEQQFHPGICPACGIAYQKWIQRQQAGGPVQPRSSRRPKRTPGQLFRELFLQVPDRVEPLVFWGRLLILVLLALWGASFIYTGIDWVAIGGSFMHNINLPFHEFGHLLFAPFGRFMAILGGSLFQVLLPLGLMLAFSLRQRDNFGASVMLWWGGQSLIDISPYIADAPYRSLPLVGGAGEAAHDWGNLLTMMDAMGSAGSIARLSFGSGSLLILLSLCWGGYLLHLQHQRLE